MGRFSTAQRLQIIKRTFIFDPLPLKRAFTLCLDDGNGPTGQSDNTVGEQDMSSSGLIMEKKKLNSVLSARRCICLFVGQEIIWSSFLNELPGKPWRTTSPTNQSAVWRSRSNPRRRFRFLFFLNVSRAEFCMKSESDYSGVVMISD